MTVKEKFLWWGLLLAGFIVFIAQIHSILLPFVVAGILAYFLDPAVDRLEELGFSRVAGTLTIIGVFFLVVTVMLLFLAPLFYEQLVDLGHKVPQYIAYVKARWLPYAANMLDRIDPHAVEKIQDHVSTASGNMFDFLARFLTNIWASSLAVVNILSLIFITPIVTFYILRDWDRIVAKLDTLLPKRHAPIIREQMQIIDNTLSGYIRGQTNVCLLLGIFYAIGLTSLGLEFGLLIGLATGILSFLPFVGLLSGFIIGITVACFQFNDLLHISLVAAVFLIGQFIEGNFITPKIVGEKVGLHPVWIIFGLLCGATLAGFTGMLLAVPVTAIIGVLVRFSLTKYIESPLYQCDLSPVITTSATANHIEIVGKPGSIE